MTAPFDLAYIMGYCERHHPIMVRFGFWSLYNNHFCRWLDAGVNIT